MHAASAEYINNSLIINRILDSINWNAYTHPPAVGTLYSRLFHEKSINNLFGASLPLSSRILGYYMYT